jgi:hypothetical protein
LRKGILMGRSQMGFALGVRIWAVCDACDGRGTSHNPTAVPPAPFPTRKKEIS